MAGWTLRNPLAGWTDHMFASYCDAYSVALPAGHRFPMGKYAALQRVLLAEGLIRHEDIHAPDEVAESDLALVHTAPYLNDVRHGTLSDAALRRLGFPWSPELVRRARLAVQGTINAGHAALADGIAANLAGGTHHSFADRGEGFCLFNDVAVAIRVLQRDASIGRAVVIDLDVHQGNGTADIFAHDPMVYTFSMHGERNYPVRKATSSLDIGLPDGTGDAEYLSVLRQCLPRVMDEARADIAFYLAGVDGAAGDRFGRMAVSDEGLYQREQCVLAAARERHLPLVITMAGGYAPTVERTAWLHAQVHRAAASAAVMAGGASAD